MIASTVRGSVVQSWFALPERFGRPMWENNERHVPVMIHRAILGSLERFIGILVEEYAGFSRRLAPTQVMVMNITDSQAEYAKNIVENLKEKVFELNRT